MAYAAVISLRYKLEQFLNYSEIIFVPSSIEILEFAYKEVKSYEEFLKRLDSSSRKKMNASLGRIKEAIYEFGEVFESHLEKMINSQSKESTGEETNPSFGIIDLQDLEQYIHSFAEVLQVEEYKEALHNPLLGEEEDDDDEAVSLRIDFGGNKSKMVGLSDQYDKLKECILHNWHEDSESLVSLVGMAGIGKTTLAKKIFEDLDILEWFNCRVWVAVGRGRQSKEILQAILAQVDPNMHNELLREADEKIDEKIGQYLRESLWAKRYLIVLDDVWDLQVYFDLKRFLRTDFSGRSRVLVTTRVQVAKGSSNLYSNCIEMRLLDNEESWDLLREKVFGEESCPPQLVKAGRKIVEHCDGLPLTIVTVANLLSKTEKTPQYWSKVAAQKNHQLFMVAYDEISKVLYPSYEYLHQYLKLCFLYMGVFPQNYKISRSKIMNLWIAEGFLESSEECAECLEELASNTLVMVYEKSSKSSLSYRWTPQAKTCGLHSSWWHLCSREAKKNNLFHVLNSRKDGLGEGMESQSRLCIHNNILFGVKDMYQLMEDNCASTTHSLLCFGPYHHYPVPICFGLRLLQHLDALKLRLYEFPLEVVTLVELKYLALTCNGELPRSISKLEKLQFLIVHRHMSIKSHGAPSYLPKKIWKMKKLKHLQIMGSDLPDCFGNSLRNLSTLLDVSPRSCTEGILERIPHLRKLGIRIDSTHDATELGRCFAHISLYTNLESLKCIIVNPELKPEIDPSPTLRTFPYSLKKLTLSGLCYPWKKMSKIASLSSLEVLKLRCNAFRGSKWEIKEDKFRGLKYLLIEDMDLEQLKVGRGSLEHLFCLSIQHCYKLKEFHCEINSLISKIEVVDCNPSIAKHIKVAMLKGGGDPDLCVHSSWNDGNLKS